MSAKIRKIVTFTEDVLSEMGQSVSPPKRRAAAAAVIENPYAGAFSEDLDVLIAMGEELGALLAARALARSAFPAIRSRAMVRRACG